MCRERSVANSWLGGGAAASLKEESVRFICGLIKERQVRTVLELGGGEGSSAVSFACSGAAVVTVERDDARARAIGERAVAYGVQDKVHVVKGDALSPDLSFDQVFDMIFIDAAKAQYQRLFEKYAPSLSGTGVIVSDNMAFHGMTGELVCVKNRSTRCLAKHLREYAAFLRTHPDFATAFYDIGDGIAVSERKAAFGKQLAQDALLFEAAGVRYCRLGGGKTLCVLPATCGEDKARGHFRRLEAAGEAWLGGLHPLEVVRVGEGFGLVINAAPVASLLQAMRAATSENERVEWTRSLALFQRNGESRCTEVAVRRRLCECGVSSYKTALRAKAGGDTKEAAPLIRDLKRLPEGECMGVLSASLDDYLVLSGGGVCFGAASELYLMPREAVACLAWLSLCRALSPQSAAARAYLDAVLVPKEALDPFAHVFCQLL